MEGEKTLKNLRKKIVSMHFVAFSFIAALAFLLLLFLLLLLHLIALFLVDAVIINSFFSQTKTPPFSQSPSPTPCLFRIAKRQLSKLYVKQKVEIEYEE